VSTETFVAKAIADSYRPHAPAGSRLTETDAWLPEAKAVAAAIRSVQERNAKRDQDTIARLDPDLVLKLAQWLHDNGGCDEPGECEECYPLAQRMALVANRVYDGAWEVDPAPSSPVEGTTTEADQPPVSDSTPKG
jgi:hypothetical protein